MFGDTTYVCGVAEDVSSPLDSDLEGRSHGRTVDYGPRVPGLGDPSGVELPRCEGVQRREDRDRTDDRGQNNEDSRDEGGNPSREPPEARVGPTSRAVVVG